MEKSEKVLVLLYNNFSSDTRVFKTCSSLTEAGYSVELWALYDPEFPEKEEVNGFLVRRNLRLATKKGLSKKKLKLFRNKILRIPVKILKNNFLLYTFAKKSFNSVESFAKIKIRSLFAKQRMRKAVENTGGEENFNFHFVHCNDLHPLSLGVKLKKNHPDIKIIYDAHEHETETTNLNIDPQAKAYMKNLEKECITHADAVITVSPDIAEDYKQMYNLKKVHVIKNCPPLLRVKPANSDYFRNYFKLPQHSTVFLYQGVIKSTRGITQILDCFSSLWENGYHDKHMVFMGYGNMQEEIVELTKKNPIIHFHPKVSISDLPVISSSADYGLIFIPNSCKSLDYCLPNKLFEYISSGIPTIASPLKTMKKLIEEENIGYITKGFTTQDLYEMILEVPHAPNPQIRDLLWKLHNEKYNWDIEKKTLIGLYSGFSQSN